jgi:iron complex transport system substrate-binding protein
LVRKSLIVLILLSLLFLAVGCQKVRVKRAETKLTEVAISYPLTVRDDAGRKITLKEKPKRLISLAPSNTEILFALGLEKRIVGVTKFCDYPPAAKKKPKIGGFADPSIEKIISLKPDLVFATGGIQQPIVKKLEEAKLTVFVIDPKTLDSLLSVLERVGKLTGNVTEARRLVKKLKQRILEVKTKVAEVKKRPKVFFELFKEPLMTAGGTSIINDLIKIAGGRNIASSVEQEYPQFSLEVLIKENPDVYLASSGSMAKPGDIKKRAGWQSIKAVKENRVYVIDENLVTRPGPRLVDGLEIFAQAIHPEIFGELNETDNH